MKKSKESEKYIEDKLNKGVKEAGGWTIKLLTSLITGLPDRLVLHKGKAFFIELKSTGKVPRPDQLTIHKKLLKFGFKVLVIDTVEGVNEFLKTLEV